MGTEAIMSIRRPTLAESLAGLVADGLVSQTTAGHVKRVMAQAQAAVQGLREPAVAWEGILPLGRVARLAWARGSELLEAWVYESGFAVWTHDRPAEDGGRRPSPWLGQQGPGGGIPDAGRGGG